MKYLVVISVLVVSFFAYRFLSPEKGQVAEDSGGPDEEKQASSRTPTTTTQKDGITYIALAADEAPASETDKNLPEDLQDRLDKAFRNKDNKVLQIEGTKYLLVANLIVVRKSDVVQEPGQLVKSFSEYAIFFPPEGETVPRDKKLKAVLNTNNNLLGVIPGTIRVLMEKGANTSSLLKNSNLQLEYSSPDIGMLYFRVLDEVDIFEVAKEIKTYPGVKSASIEIIESEAVPH